MHVPATVGDLTDTWLSTALGRPVSITGIERIGEGFGLASEVFRVTVEGVQTDSVVAKLWSADSTADTTEVEFYRTLAQSVPGGIPTALYSAANDERAILVLEFIAGEQGDVLVPRTSSEVLTIAATLARIHGAFWADRTLDRHEWLRDGWAGPTDEWFATRPGLFHDRFGSIGSELGRKLLDDAHATFRAGTRRLEELPQTLVHGDLHLDNILIGAAPVILDWASCRRGPGVQDLASVIFTMGETVSIEPALATYTSGLAESGIEMDLGSLERALGGAVLWSFLFWTLGTAAWMPADDRGRAMQLRHHADAVRMVEVWVERDPELMDEVVE